MGMDTLLRPWNGNSILQPLPGDIKREYAQIGCHPILQADGGKQDTDTCSWLEDRSCHRVSSVLKKY